jgi:hypothetical protein
MATYNTGLFGGRGHVPFNLERGSINVALHRDARREEA